MRFRVRSFSIYFSLLDKHLAQRPRLLGRKCEHFGRHSGLLAFWTFGLLAFQILPFRTLNTSVLSKPTVPVGLPVGVPQFQSQSAVPGLARAPAWHFLVVSFLLLFSIYDILSYFIFSFCGASSASCFPLSEGEIFGDLVTVYKFSIIDIEVCPLHAFLRNCQHR